MTRAIAMLLLFALTAPAAAAPLPCGAGAGAMVAGASGTTLEVKTNATTVSVVLAKPPSTRVRVSFDEIAGKHVELEWDPALDRNLARTATLTPGTWEISVQADSSLLQRGPDSSLLVVEFGNTELDATGKLYQIKGTYKEVSSGSDKLSQGMPLTGMPGPLLKIRCDAPKQAMDEVAFARPTTAVPGQRGLTDGLREPVAEVLSLLGEIAVERAKAGAMGLLQRRIVEPLCGAVDADGEETTGGISLDDLRLGGQALALPRTCEVLQRLRLDDVLAAGKPLLRALRDDLRLTIAPAGIRAAAGDTAWSVIARHALAAVNRAIDQQSLSVLDAQVALDLFRDLAPLLSIAPIASIADPSLQGLIKAALDSLDPKVRAALCPKTPSDSQACAVALLGEVHSSLELDQLAIRIRADRKQLADRLLVWVLAQVRATADPKLVAAVAFACHARLAVTVVRACSDGSCTPQSIADRLTSPHEYFEPDTKGPAQLCWDAAGRYVALPDANLAAFRDLVVVGLELIDTARGPQGLGRAVALLRVLVSFGQRAAGCDEPTVAGEARKACDRLAATGELLIALAEEDHARALTSATTLVQQLLGDRKLPKGLAKASQLFGAVAAYAKVHDETKDDDPKAAREARKQALQSMIDAATDRHGRSSEDNGVWSIGSNVGLSSTWTWARDTDGELVDDAGWAPQVRVPLAITWQKLPPTGKCPVGFHVGLVLADLGQFAAVGDDKGSVDDVRWNNFLSPGLELGVLLGRRSETKLNLSVHAVYAPTLFQPDSPDAGHAGAIRFGISLGYYVPFFDFN